MMLLNIFLWIVFIHFVGDYVFQSSYLADNKGKDWWVMFVHCVLWTGCICIFLKFMGLYDIWKFFFLLIGHAISDTWKSKTPNRGWKIYVDQSWHIVQCLLCYFIK